MTPTFLYAGIYLAEDVEAAVVPPGATPNRC